METQSEQNFVSQLYLRMLAINPGIAEMEVFEFGYGLEPLIPEDGWQSVVPVPKVDIEQKIKDCAFFISILLRPTAVGKPVMDAKVRWLTQTLFAGLVAGFYAPEWIRQNFYFDIRGFYFIVRTIYYSEEVINRLGGEPFRQFEPKQKQFEGVQAVGYKDFMEANAEVDQCFMDLSIQLVSHISQPIIMAIAGQTAAGKTEITARLVEQFRANGQSVTTLEMDHFLLDRDYREAKGIDSLGMDALHYELFKECLHELGQGKPISIPRYDFISATSSHDADGHLKTGCQLQSIDPAQIIIMEGNFPFIDPEIAELIGIKIMYLTDDDVRMKRKWKRDMDYRKKYELNYFLNRYFREQFIMAEKVYRPQMALCDVIVDTTQAALWVAPDIQQRLNVQNSAEKL